MKRIVLLMVCAASPLSAQLGRVAVPATPAQQACPTAGLTLPAGFCATVFADGAAGARHVAVAPNGDVFVNMNPPASGRNPAASVRPSGGTILALRDTDRDGKADMQRRFGTGGGTGIAIQGNSLYATSGNSIVRYRIPSGSLTPTGRPDTIVTDLPMTGHRSHNFVLVGGRAMYVNIGSESNACQQQNRQAGSPGIDPCTELDSRAGIWVFDANRLHQRVADGRRYATGIRNAVALTRNPFDGQLYATVHGRDQLHDNWPALYTTTENAENPGEILIRIERGADYGWPYCYHDMVTGSLVLAPEYGGGDKRTVGQCSTKAPALMAFPAHWAPNGMAFYTSSTFPSQYRGGAFIAFHGSWNRAPLPQAGFRVVFAPFRGNRPAGTFTTFADGFMTSPPAADRVTAGLGVHRPVGLAESPDGALYITDDAGGTIYKVVYRRTRRN